MPHYHCLVLLQTPLDKKKIKIIHILTKIFTLNLQIFVSLIVKFCSYSRLLKKEMKVEYSTEQMLDKIKSYDEDSITEVHIVGGVHPKMGLNYFVDLIKKIKSIRPKLHIKAFTAVELNYMCKKLKLAIKVLKC